MRPIHLLAVASMAASACGAPAPDDGPADGQRPGAEEVPVSPAERAAVLEPLQLLFDALESGDASTLPAIMDERIVMHSTARDAEGRVTASSTTLAGLVERIESAEVPSIERMFDPQVRVSGDLAMIWTPYDFYRGTELSHCGIDSALLERRDGTWVITALSWTRAQPPACALHPDGPPGG